MDRYREREIRSDQIRSDQVDRYTDILACTLWYCSIFLGGGLGVIYFPRFFGTFLFFLLVLDTFKVAIGKPAYTEYCF